MPASDFCPASDLPASPSRETQLEGLVRTQALVLERLEAMLDGPQQAPGGKLSGQEKAAIVQALSNLEGRIKAQEQATKGLGKLRADLNAASTKIDEMHGLTKERLNNFSRRLTDLEFRSKPKETTRNLEHIHTIWVELLKRQKAGVRGITYAEAAKLCQVDKSVIKKLKGLISADSRLDIIWHPTRKNTKLICLKNYK